METRTMFCDYTPSVSQHRKFWNEDATALPETYLIVRDLPDCLKLGQASVSGAFGFSMSLVTEVVQCLVQPFPCLKLMAYFAMIGLHGDEVHF